MAGYGRSDTGKVREINQDTILVENESVGIFPNLYIIADGMGGHLAGEVASRMAVSCMKEFLQKFQRFQSSEDIAAKDYADVLLEAAASANEIVLGSASDDRHRAGMGTTLLAMMVAGGKAYIINVGDSRLYLINPRTDRMEQITVDHSYVMELVLNGKITMEEAEHHPNKNIITRALGTNPSVECDRFVCQLAEDDVVLMCSDGLTNMVSNEKILSIFKQCQQKTDAVERLIDEANNMGGMDNISVILYSQVDGV